MTATPRFQLADELLRRFAAAMRSSQLYTPGHPIITRNLGSLSAAMQLMHAGDGLAGAPMRHDAGEAFRAHMERAELGPRHVVEAGAHGWLLHWCILKTKAPSRGLPGSGRKSRFSISQLH